MALRRAAEAERLLALHAPHLAAAARLTRTRVAAAPAHDLAAQIAAAFPHLAAGGGGGRRCVVVASASAVAARRAQVVPHFLRKGGFLPLLCELQDGAAPAAYLVQQVVEQARRAGACDLVVAYGGAAAISVGRVVASLLAGDEDGAGNGVAVAGGGRRRLIDYAPALGGRAALSAAAVPFLAVPSCPAAGLELTREALVLLDGSSLATLKMHPRSRQACLLDPALAVSLEGDAQLATNFAALALSVEAYTRTDADAVVRALAWRAVQLAASFCGRSLADPRDTEARAALALASALTSAAVATGPLGVSRGLGLAVASRFRIPFSAAVAAVAPEALSSAAEFLQGKLEEEQEEQQLEEKEDEARVRGQDGLEGGGDGVPKGAMVWRDNVGLGLADGYGGLRHGGGPQEWSTGSGGGRSPFPQRSRVRPRAHERRGEATATGASSEDAEAETEDARDERRLRAFASSLAAADAAGGASDGERADDSEVALAARRYSHVALALQRAAVSLRASAPPPALLELDVVCALASSALPPLGSLGPLLLELRAGRGGGPGNAASQPYLVRDFALGEADLKEAADLAEVDDNTLAGGGGGLARLAHGDLMDLLRRS